MQLSGEDAEQAAVVHWLRRRGHLHWHTPNQSQAPPNYRQKLAAMGLRAGVPDILILTGPPLRLIGLEMKTERGRASQDQIDFIRALHERGGIGRVCYGREDAIQWLITLGL